MPERNNDNARTGTDTATSSSQRSQSGLALAMAALFLLVGALGIVGSWGAYWQDTGIQKSGQRAVGRVVEKSILAVADGDSDYIVNYWFELPDGQRIEGSQSVDKTLWVALREGETLAVLYSATNPRRNFPQGAGVTSLGVTIFVSILMAALGLFGALLLVHALRGRHGAAPSATG